MQKLENILDEMSYIQSLETDLKDVIFHALCLLARHHQMNVEDAISFIENDCSSISWHQEDYEGEL